MAKTSVGQIGLDLVVNQNKFNKQMSGITNLAKKAGAVLAGAFAVKKIADFGKSCLDLGSDLAEVQNVVDVTFPSMTARVDEFAKSAITSFGLSETMAKKFTGTFGAMAKAFGFSEQQAYDMSSTLTGLAGDVASFYNISQDEAYTKLKSVFTGETETLKDLGVVMTQSALDAYAMANGFGKTTQAMSEAEKVALRYQFVQDKLAAAQGDFSRTSGSWANQVRILNLQFDSLKATIGQGLINLFTPVIRVINAIIGKLATLANAFKSFTELITGNKSTGSSGSSIADMGVAATDAGTGLENASGAADNMASSANKAGNAAKKAAKEMRSLMGFDQINKLSEQTEDSADSGDTGGSGGGGSASGLGSAVDFGSLAQGETVIDKTDKKLHGLIERCKELAALFKKGFKIGFGDSEKKIQSIEKSIKSIGKSLKEIFTDPAIVASANKCVDSIALALGKASGSMARIGITMADNLIGGIDKYLSKSKKYIKKRIVSIFDATGEIADLVGDYYVACADIFDVFSGDDAKGITADIIQVFSDGFLGATDLAAKFARDFISFFTAPITQNVDKIKLTLENMLSRWRIIFDTIAQSVTETFDKINQVYDESFRPFIDSIAQGISDIVGKFLDAYNTYISPVLDYLADKFSTVWAEHIKPALDGCIELLGKLAENLQALWETVIVPFIEWIIETIMPVLGPIIARIGDLILDLLAVAGDVIKGITDILGGFLDFCTGVFTGDFDKCWQGIEEILSGFKTIAGSIIEFVQKYILQPFIDFVKGVFETAWTTSITTLGNVFKTFLEGVKTVWNGIKRTFKGIIEFVRGTFTGDWDKAWQGIKDIFGGIFESLVGLAKTPLNMVIDIVNGLLSALNSGLRAVENAFTFDWGFTNPITGTQHNWHFGMDLPTIPTIPHLAQGGFVKANTPQLAMIGDNRHQGEVVAPEDKLREMAMETAKAAGAGGVTREELESIINRAVMRIVAALADMGFYLDGRQLATAEQAAREGISRQFNNVGFV